MDRKVSNERVDREFDHILSLGGACQSAYQIRRRFQTERAFPFDWWVTPARGLVELVESAFGDLFNPRNLKIVTENRSQWVLCRRYGIVHYHDFDEARIDGRLHPFLVRAACARNVEKFAYLYRQLVTLTGRVLFVRCGDAYVPQNELTGEFDSELLARLVAGLKRLIPGAESSFLLLNGYTGPAVESVHIDTVDSYGDTTWQGSSKGWDEMFERLGITLRKA